VGSEEARKVDAPHLMFLSFGSSWYFCCI
jgi:hypothetical protein